MRAAIIVFPGSNRERDIGRALKSLDVDGFPSARQGKVFDIEFAGGDKAWAEAALATACEKRLVNTVIENFSIELAS